MRFYMPSYSITTALLRVSGLLINIHDDYYVSYKLKGTPNQLPYSQFSPLKLIYKG